ncbi:MAG: hypothetical protein V3V55_01780 [Rhodospirillales bacterium]
MGKNGIIEADDAPTEPTDWIGAAEVRPGETRPAIKPGATIFHVYRSSTDSSLFAATDNDDRSRLPPCPGGGKWEFFKCFSETGQTRIGFSEEDAKRDIRKMGYHLDRIDIETAERLAPPKAS